MELKYLSYVITIAEEGTLSGAAKRLYISQPNLSIYLTKLEQELGVKLFTREENCYIPTQAGQEYLRSARQILELSNATDFYINEIKELHHGTIILGMAAHMEEMLIPMVLPLWKKAFPNFKYKFVESNGDTVLTLLAKHQLDIGIFQGGKANQNFTYVPISKEDFLLAAPKAFQLSQHSTGHYQNLYPFLEAKYLADVPVILQAPGHLREKAMNLFYKNKIQPNIVAETGSISTANRLCKAGVGVTFITSIIAHLDKEDLDGLDLFLIEPPSASGSWTMDMAYNTDTYLKPIIDKMIGITQNELSKFF